MKNLILTLTTVVAITSCQYFQPTNKTGVDSTSTREDGELITMRDTTITPVNAYTDMFLDSNAVENFIKSKNIEEGDARAIRSFYNTRNYQYAWFAKDGLTEQGRAFWNAYTYGKAHGQKDATADKFLNKRMDTIVGIDTVAIVPSDTSYAGLEEGITLKFIQYRRNSKEQSLINQLPISYLIPVKKMDALAMADTILNFKTTASATDTLNKPFYQLRQQLAMYDSVAKKGGWQPIAGKAGKLKKGTSSPIVTSIKKRLIATGEMGGTDTSAKFTDSLAAAIKNFQQSNGFKPDGVITDSLIGVMNVPANERLKQILVNLNRMAWLPPQIKDNYVEVNIPEYMLYVYDGDTTAFNMPVVVGKEGSNTMMFTGDINEIVFSPYWNIPPSIVKEDILPAMQADPNYLKNKRMEVVSKNDTLPVIRQLPGPDNALGKVKFLFPNSYNIYLHDTNAKDIFENKKRAFSHGCIRLADSEKMAEYLLSGEKNWSPEKINAAMNSNKQQEVPVKKPVPVVIAYFTTWVDTQGNLNFREDVYSHDKRMADRMFTATT
jgi:L,D-transpeptidase YcbB